MKYENFEKAKALVEKINNIKVLINDLSSDNVSVRLLDGQCNIITIGAWESCEHSRKDLAIEFVGNLVRSYKNELDKTLEDLSYL
jgi:hypothetical protein